MKPRDVIWCKGHLWEVQGVHLGGLTQESVIALKVMNLKPAWDEKELEVMHVPEILLREGIASGIFTYYEKVS